MQTQQLESSHSLFFNFNIKYEYLICQIRESSLRGEWEMCMYILRLEVLMKLSRYPPKNN